MQKHSIFYGLPCKEQSKDVVLQMPADGSTFTKREEIWPHFKDEHHNLRLSLVAHNVNPFGEFKSTYPVLSVFIINNNIRSETFVIHIVEKCLFGLITLLGFGLRFEPTNVVHPQDKVKKSYNIHV